MRKMASAQDESGYSRYKKYSTHKLLRLREMFREGIMTTPDVEALRDCADTFAEIRQVHDGKL
jgi:hypothetical protein